MTSKKLREEIQQQNGNPAVSHSRDSHFFRVCPVFVFSFQSSTIIVWKVEIFKKQKRL
jgi:hypothetical protein